MHILHVTPHLPPDQAANALLPWQLGTWARDAGHTVAYVAHPPRAEGGSPLAGPVTWVQRRARGPFDAALPLGALGSAWRMRRALGPALQGADVVHVHSNGLLAEAAVLLAQRRQLPVVLTLYGTEIWHYRPTRFAPDLFAAAYRRASIVTFYSERLLERARELGLGRPGMETVYPAVSPAFAWRDVTAQARGRAALGVSSRYVLLNVKRLHPLAGQRDLIASMPAVLRVHPDTILVICGTGPLVEELAAATRAAGVEHHVRFAGLVDNASVAAWCAAADLFVLPSILEALPTVAVEALASGTPVVSTDNPGGLELNGIFGADVVIVPREQPDSLAAAIAQFLSNPRRTCAGTQQRIEGRFRAAAVWQQYAALYAKAVEGRAR